MGSATCTNTYDLRQTKSDVRTSTTHFGTLSRVNYRQRQQAVTTYCRARLTKETKGEKYGIVAKVARNAGLAGPTLSTIISGKAVVGPDVEDRLARYWGMTPLQLEAAALGRPDSSMTSVLERARAELLADPSLSPQAIEQIKTMEFSGLETQLVTAAKRAMLAFVMMPQIGGDEEELEAEIVARSRERKRLKP